MLHRTKCTYQCSNILSLQTFPPPLMLLSSPSAVVGATAAGAGTVAGAGAYESNIGRGKETASRATAGFQSCARVGSKSLIPALLPRVFFDIDTDNCIYEATIYLFINPSIYLILATQHYKYQVLAPAPPLLPLVLLLLHYFVVCCCCSWCGCRFGIIFSIIYQCTDSNCSGSGGGSISSSRSRGSRTL